jgi:hypothetical protein
MRPSWIEDVPAPLSGVITKLDRAHVHLTEAHRIVTDVISVYKQSLILEPDANAAKVVVRLGDVPKLPDDFTAIVGDFFHNTRSALDHLAWQLVLHNGLEPTDRTAFPVLRSSQPGRLEVTPGVSAEALALIEEVQPYRWGEDPTKFHLSPLAVLSRLNNVDKHRVPLVGVTVLRGGSWSSAPDQTIEFHRSIERRAFGRGDVVGHFTIQPPGTRLHDVDLDFAVRLVDDSEGAEYATFDFVEWAMRSVLHYVEYAVLDRFVPLLQERRSER